MSSVSAHSILLPIISDNGIDLDHDQEKRQLLCSAFCAESSTSQLFEEIPPSAEEPLVPVASALHDRAGTPRAGGSGA